jgi:hypothetical protein
MEVKELAKAEGFGDLICLYPFHKTSGLSLLILSLIIIPIAVLMLLTGIALAIGVSEFGLVAGILGVVLAFFGLAAICFIPQGKRKKKCTKVWYLTVKIIDS